MATTLKIKRSKNQPASVDKEFTLTDGELCFFESNNNSTFNQNVLTYTKGSKLVQYMPMYVYEGESAVRFANHEPGDVILIMEH